MALSIKLTRQAEQDITEILDYTRVTWGEQQAMRYSDLLLSTLQLLASNPGISRSHPGAARDARKHNCGSHVILLNVTSVHLTVLRILHKSMLDRAADWIDDED